MRDTLEIGEDRVAVSRVHIDARVQERIERAERQGRDIPSTRSYWAEYPYPSHFPALRESPAEAGGGLCPL